LPVAASLQFFLGYPLRVKVGAATAFLLQMQGLDVWREGVCLHFGEKLIWIDAPCSGIKMLWFGFFLASFLVCFYRLSNFKAAAVLGSAFLIILLGNIFRASALFYIEAEIIKTPAFMHEAVGVFAFAFTAVGIFFAAQFWRNLPCGAQTRFNQNMIAPKAGIQRVMSTEIRIFTILFLTGCFTAFFASHWLPGEKSIKPAVQSSNVFPPTFEGFEIKKLPLSERESYFLEDFPGHIGRFSDGKREIIIRYVREATRKLHPASDCFRAIGYSTKPLPLKVDGEGKRWSCFTAVKAGEKLRVCERIYNFEGDEWTDVSSWYWAALGEPDGEWWAITVAERSND
jgi:exosortase/archaeosortase family protein